MKRTAKIFCEDEGIPVVTIMFHSLRVVGAFGIYSTPYSLIVIDTERENDHVMTFFHELIHHWQHSKIPKGWYKRWIGRIPHSDSIYRDSTNEVEARSFARSICEDLDS